LFPINDVFEQRIIYVALQESTDIQLSNRLP
jgi:hypothetical protein